MEAVDEPTGLIQFAAQRACDRIPTAGAAGQSPAVPLVGGLQFVCNPLGMSVQLAQQCSCLCAPRILDHLRILSCDLNVRAVTRDVCFVRLVILMGSPSTAWREPVKNFELPR